MLVANFFTSILTFSKENYKAVQYFTRNTLKIKKKIISLHFPHTHLSLFTPLAFSSLPCSPASPPLPSPWQCLKPGKHQADQRSDEQKQRGGQGTVARKLLL
jgi:hypothetical protein